MRSGLLCVVLYGLLNAAAYACLLPPWEGFDEAYHYGYVQLLSTCGEFPVLGHARLSQEIWHALELAPVSHYLQPFTGAPVNFREYFALPEAERVRRRQALEALPRDEKFGDRPDKNNYEVNQSPLPYLLMAPLDWALHDRPITQRVLVLRLACAFLAVLLLAHSTLLLARSLGLPDVWCAMVLFCAYSSQMLYATICHVCNDWLAVALLPYFIWAASRVRQEASRRTALALGAFLALILLSKAYFLVLIPLALFAARRLRPMACMAAALLVLAGPWYARNLVLYHNLSGTVEQTAGAGPGQLLSNLLKLPWLDSVRYMALSSLWTGNNSFTTFSAATLWILLGLLAAALTMYAIRARRTSPEVLTGSAILLFIAALAGITLTFFVSSKGLVTAAVPWYMQVLLTPVLSLAFLGLYRSGRPGRVIAAALMLLWSYLQIATFFVKLIPQYAGFTSGRTRLSSLWTWYLHAAPARDSMLRTICLASPAAIYTIAIAAVLLGLALLLLQLSRKDIDFLDGRRLRQ